MYHMVTVHYDDGKNAIAYCGDNKATALSCYSVLLMSPGIRSVNLYSGHES